MALRRPLHLWTWLPVVLWSAIAVFSYFHRAGSFPLEDATRKSQLLGALRQQFQTAVAAGKGSVLAITDAESKAFVDRTRRTDAAVDSVRQELETVVRRDGLEAEIAAITGFDSCWARHLELDHVILGAVAQGTDLQSAELSVGRKRLVAAQCEDELASLQAAIAEGRPHATK